MAKEICVSPKWEMEVTCDSCNNNVTLGSSDIVRLITSEYPYGGILGFVYNKIIIPTYYGKCPKCEHLQHIKRRAIPKRVRKKIQTLTTFY